MNKDPLYNERLLNLGRNAKKNLPEKFCAAPFSQMFIYPTGDVFVCCEGAGHLGNLKDKNLDELWNGPVATQLRSEFLEGNPIICKKNISCKSCHNSYDHLIPFTDLEIKQPTPPKALDVILNGKCNIDCIMCTVKTQVQSVTKIPNFQTEIVEKIYPTLKKIAVKSGEPFIQKETYELIDTLSKVNPECGWSFTTNGQYNFSLPIKKALEKITIDKITFSIDSIDPANYAAVRVKGSLEKCLKTIEDMRQWENTKEQKHSIEFQTTITIQKENWHTVPQTFKALYDMNLRPNLIFVFDPQEFSLLTFPDAKKHEILLFFLNLPRGQDLFFPQYYLALHPLIHEENHMTKKLRILLDIKVQDIYKRKFQICTLPFSQISIYPDGTLKPCCWLNDYNLKEDVEFDFYKAWNSDKMKKLRQDFVDEKFQICDDKIKQTGCNTKHFQKNDLIDFKVDQNKIFPTLQWFFNGKCNLECQTCHNWQFDQEFEGAQECWNILKEKVLPYLCEVELVGGEPFYQKRTLEFLTLMKEINPQCLWYITSNGQLSFNYVKKYITGIEIGVFAVSIDSLDPQNFAKIRAKGVLEKTLNFLDELIILNQDRPTIKQFTICLNFVLQKDNWHELKDIILFAQEKNTNLYIIPAITPFKHSIYDLEVEKMIQLYQLVCNLLVKDSRDKKHSVYEQLSEVKVALELKLSKLESVREENLLAFF